MDMMIDWTYPRVLLYSSRLSGAPTGLVVQYDRDYDRNSFITPGCRFQRLKLSKESTLLPASFASSNQRTNPRSLICANRNPETSQQKREAIIQGPGGRYRCPFERSEGSFPASLDTWVPQRTSILIIPILKPSQRTEVALLDPSFATMHAWYQETRLTLKLLDSRPIQEDGTREEGRGQNSVGRSFRGR